MPVRVRGELHLGGENGAVCAGEDDIVKAAEIVGLDTDPKETLSMFEPLNKGTQSDDILIIVTGAARTGAREVTHTALACRLANSNATWTPPATVPPRGRRRPPVAYAADSFAGSSRGVRRWMISQLTTYAPAAMVNTGT